MAATAAELEAATRQIEALREEAANATSQIDVLRARLDNATSRTLSTALEFSERYLERSDVERLNLTRGM